MKRLIACYLVLTAFVFAVTPVYAGPTAPTIQISLTPAARIVQPGQLVLLHVGGGYPLDIQATLDDVPLELFWSGDGYVALIAFPLDAAPGEYGLSVAATEAGTGRTAQLQTVLTLESDNYPFESVGISGPLEALLDPALNQAELDRIDAVTAPVTARLSWDPPFRFPVVSVITSLYGGKRDYNYGALAGRHTGLDFRMAEGVEVFAPAEGRVVVAQAYDVRGNVVMIDHGWGVYTQYAHMSSIAVAEGDEVVVGQVLGKAGRSGRSTASHLHWEVIVNGVPVDPLAWMALSPAYIQPAIVDRDAE